MGIINLPQNSPEWLEWRRSRVTATDVSILLGSNPFRTRLELWEEKLQLRPPQELNSAMTRGQTLEPEARKLACELLDIKFEPIVCESTENPWLAASLDGISECNKYILEIKCPKLSVHENAIKGQIADYYKDQMQTQLLVTGCEKCYFCSYFPKHEKEIVIIKVFPNQDKQQEIIILSKEFYIQLCNIQPPIEWKLKQK